MSESRSHNRIYIITVIYNRFMKDIRSLSEFRALMEKHPEVRLIVTDNSTDERILKLNREAASRSTWVRYLECGGNIGLSRAYNRALATIPQKESFWVMLSDDDTKFSMEYLENGCRQIRREEGKRKHAERDRDTRTVETSGTQRDPLRVLCGVVRTQSGWMSPRSEHTREFAFSSLLKPPGPGIYRDLYPVNSGLFLDGNAIRLVGGYDERLFLDQVDFLMMDRLRAAGIRNVGVLPGEILQDFSGDFKAYGDKKSRENKRHYIKERWEIFRKDFENYCELTGKPWYYRTYLLNRRRLMIMIQKVLQAYSEADST